MKNFEIIYTNFWYHCVAKNHLIITLHDLAYTVKSIDAWGVSG